MWCLTKDAVQRFKRAIKDGEVDPVKMADMTSGGRRTLLAKFVGEENAKQVNALFESKLLLKNQKAGYISWAKKIVGITPKVKQDLIARIERLDTALDPKSEKQFLEDLVSSRLRLDVTQEEAQNIFDLSNKTLNLKEKSNKDGVFPTETDRLSYGLSKVVFEKYINDLKLQSRAISFREQPLTKIVSLIGELPGTFKSAVASFDNSFWGRQGVKTLADVRTSKIWFKNFLKSWADIGKQITAKGKIWKSGDDAVMDSIKADIYSRPNALNGKYKAGGYQLDILSEEAYPSSIPERIPLLGRLFKASEVAYNGGALRLRADLADRLITIADKSGVNTLNPDEAKGIGHLVGSLTGRGSLGKAEVLAKETNVLFFSVKFLKSNIDTLIAPEKYVATKLGLRTPENKGFAFAEREAAKSTMNIVATMGVLLLLANLFDPDEVDEDPRSTNFGKIKIFGHWVDITGGMASLVTLLARMTPTKHNGKWGIWKKSSTGNWTNMIGGEYGTQTAWDNIMDTLISNKLSPAAGLLRDAMRGEMFSGKKFNLQDAVANLVTPLSIQNFKQLKEDPNSSFILGSVILEGLGLSTSTYLYKADWNKNPGEILKQFKEEVGEDKFQKANDDFNRAYWNWYSIAGQSNEFKGLSEDGKSDLITKAKEQIKQQIFEEYGFKYKTLRKTEEEKKEKETIKELLPK